MSGSLIRAHEEFTKLWTTRFNSLNEMAGKTREGVASIATGLAQNFAALKANLDMNSDAMEQLDIFNQIWAKMFLFIIERMEQEKFLRTNNIPDLVLRNTDLEEIKSTAQTSFQDMFQLSKDKVIEERQAYLKELRTKVEQEAKTAEPVTEEVMAREVLLNAERGISMAGGEGSAIPDGAEIFGGA